ncbi:MAG: glycosyltransferase family 2 protein [Verrucomicrobia bacterium]|nr:glycosyltransferase family 2 protein [Verrucomicrobiota bacterium]
MNTQAKISIVVPFLNEEENLPELYRRLSAVFSGRSETAEFLFVDDGSTDGSFQWLEKTQLNDPRVRILQLSRNFGHQIAITAGMDYAEADAVVIIDADLQDPPEVIADLIAKWREGFEVVYAVRRSREGETWLKKFLASSFYRIFHQMAKVNVPMDAGDFRLVDRKVIDALKEVRELHRFMRGLTCWVGFRQCAVEYDRAARHAGETKYPVWKSLKLAWDGITSFSGKPLQWMMNLGLLVALVSALLAFRIIWMKLSGNGELVSGWASLSVLVLFLGGVQLIALGLLGQCISRIFDESKKRPLYIVRNSGVNA